MQKLEPIIISPQKGFQQNFVESDIDIVFGGGAAGVGKALSVKEQVLTKNGFVTISSLKVGDKILDVRGQEQEVLGVYPQGYKAMAKIEFESGKSAKCCKEHLWEVKVLTSVFKNHWDIMNTREMQLFIKRAGALAIPTFLDYRYKTDKVISITDLEEEEECVCIKVSSKEGLFVISEYIVTHNTSAAVLSMAYYVDNPQYRALYVRKNLGELKGGGSMLEEFQKLYPSQLISRVTTSDNPEVEFKSGCKVVMTHLANESVEEITERVKGWQYDFIYLDELTAYQFSTFTYLLSRNRGSSGEKGRMRATTNPKKNSWVRQFIDWYIDDEGYIDPKRDGVVRYFYYLGGGIEGVVWGDTKEEVYQKCQETIDRHLVSAKLDYLSPHNLIKSFTFYSGKLGDNKIKMKQDPDYAGSIAMAGGAQAEMLLGGNWNIDITAEEQSIITQKNIMDMFDNDPQVIYDRRYITVDIALEGGDNLVALVWYDFHIADAVILSGSITPAEAINAVQVLQDKHDIGNMNVVYDSIGAGTFFGGFITGARRFNSNFAVSRSGKGKFENARAECVYKLAEMLQANAISIEGNLANRLYKHIGNKQPKTIKEEMLFESKAFVPIRKDNGKIKMPTKKEMQLILGKGRSPDLIDPMVMRMYLDLSYVPSSAVPSGEKLMENKREVQHINMKDFFNNW